MKKTLCAAALMLAVLCSCTKEGAKRFEGYYSYKLSGTVSLKAVEEETDESSDGTVTVAPDELTLSLNPESGQMNILTRDNDSGEMLVTMNAVGGDVTTFEAVASGKQISFSETQKRVSFETSSISTRSCTLTLSGDGEKLDDVIVISFKAVSGEYSYLGRKYEVTDSKIECVAKSND